MDGIVAEIELEILRQAKGIANFRAKFPPLLRAEIDRVIDSHHTGRYFLRELEKTEKTYLGTRVEIALRHFLGLSKGEKLDLRIGEREVDIKNTVRSNWSIPPETQGYCCVLIRIDEDRALFDFGLVRITEDILNPGGNRDGKRSISAVGLESVRWIFEREPYPANFFNSLRPETLNELRLLKTGAARMAALFRELVGTPVSREAVIAVVRQNDSLKRLRKNGGARDALEREGIALLSGKYDTALIAAMGLPPCGPTEFISFRPVTGEQVEALRRKGVWDVR
ncbi:MAG: hypothetical protein FJW30_03000 [Acidobacteria bacterium]|nr:hypothetical protein [Acidobacteriota bacterium]